MIEYANSRIVAVIDEYVHNERNRAILKDRFVNGLTFEQIAEKHDISTRQAQNIVYRSQDVLFRHL